MATATKDYINQMYDENYNAQKAQLDQNYQQGVENLQQEQQKAQKQTDENLTRTYVEAAKAAKNYGEVQNAYGLSSGAMAQAKLAQGTQLQGDMAAIRAAQQTVDADVEREKSLLAKEYAAAIAKAKAENNMEKAQALYQAAKEEDDALLQKQKAAANLMAGVGDYSLIAQLYGLTPEQVAKLQEYYNSTLEGNGTETGSSGSGSGGGGGNEPKEPEEETQSGSGLSATRAQEVSEYVQKMLDNASGSQFDPSRVIAGNSSLNQSEKDYAQAVLEELIGSGYMKKKS